MFNENFAREWHLSACNAELKMELTVEELQVAFKKSKTGKATGNKKKNPPK